LEEIIYPMGIEGGPDKDMRRRIDPRSYREVRLEMR
jgi:hypothetical protein